MTEPKNEQALNAEGLENCPFCGDRAILHKSKRTKGYYIVCDNFDCQASKSGGTRTAAIRNWNLRAKTSTQQPTEQIGAVSEELIKRADVLREALLTTLSTLNKILLREDGKIVRADLITLENYIETTTKLSVRATKGDSNG